LELDGFLQLADRICGLLSALGEPFDPPEEPR